MVEAHEDKERYFESPRYAGTHWCGKLSPKE